MMQKFAVRLVNVPHRAFSSQQWESAARAVPALPTLPAHLFEPFSLGSINRVKSTPNNKAPSAEDTIEGRYAGVLFTTASGRESLYEVYEDMMYLSELYTHSECFR